METQSNATSPLAGVAGCQTGPTVARLLDIQESKERHQKFLRYIKHLECLHLGETHERKPVPVVDIGRRSSVCRQHRVLEGRSDLAVRQVKSGLAGVPHCAERGREEAEV